MIGALLMLTLLSAGPIERLQTLDGHDPRACLALGEDLIETPGTVGHGRHLLVVAAELGDSPTRRSALRALQAVDDSPQARALLHAHVTLAASTHQGLLPAVARPGSRDVDLVARQAGDVLGLLAAGRAHAARELSRDDRVVTMLDAVGVSFDPSLDVELDTRNGRPARHDARLHHRVVLYDVDDLPWMFLAGTGDADMHVSPLMGVAEFYGVNPDLRWWRDGRWVDLR